jgi:hypothetical protein
MELQDSFTFEETPKSMALVWRSRKPEAGNFVEVKGYGGIVSINDVYNAGESRELVFHKTNALICYSSSNAN